MAHNTCCYPDCDRLPTPSCGAACRRCCQNASHNHCVLVGCSMTRYGAPNCKGKCRDCCTTCSEHCAARGCARVFEGRDITARCPDGRCSSCCTVRSHRHCCEVGCARVRDNTKPCSNVWCSANVCAPSSEEVARLAEILMLPVAALLP